MYKSACKHTTAARAKTIVVRDINVITMRRYMLPSTVVSANKTCLTSSIFGERQKTYPPTILNVDTYFYYFNKDAQVFSSDSRSPPFLAYGNMS